VKLCHIYPSGPIFLRQCRCRIPIWQTFGQIQWHVIPERPTT